jgi:hypothetical protein
MTFFTVKTCRKSAPFRLWVFPGWRPYPGDYGRAFASSGILYPLRHCRFLRSGYHGLAWRGWGLPRSAR